MIDSVSNNTATSTDYSVSTPQAITGSANKDDFLRLLVAELQNQNPMSPKDGSEFVAQLAQFSQLEQIVSINKSIDTIVQALPQLQASSAAQSTTSQTQP